MFRARDAEKLCHCREVARGNVDSGAVSARETALPDSARRRGSRKLERLPVIGVSPCVGGVRRGVNMGCGPFLASLRLRLELEYDAVVGRPARGSGAIQIASGVAE